MAETPSRAATAPTACGASRAHDLIDGGVLGCYGAGNTGDDVSATAVRQRTSCARGTSATTRYLAVRAPTRSTAGRGRRSPRRLGPRRAGVDHRQRQGERRQRPGQSDGGDGDDTLDGGRGNGHLRERRAEHSLRGVACDRAARGWPLPPCCARAALAARGRGAAAGERRHRACAASPSPTAGTWERFGDEFRWTAS